MDYVLHFMAAFYFIVSSFSVLKMCIVQVIILTSSPRCICVVDRHVFGQIPRCQGCLDASVASTTTLDRVEKLCAWHLYTERYSLLKSAEI